MSGGVLKIGTRGSALARWQTDWIRERLARHAVQTDVVVITTQGDAEVDRPLHELEGTGFFTKGIEDALLDGRVDIAVHSLKDLPTTFPPGLMLGAVPELDSIAVVNLITALEEHFGIVVADDEIGASVFETLCTLTRFVEGKLAG